MTRQEEKQTLRGIMKRLEQQLSPAYRERADRSIAAHLLAMPEYQEAQTVFCFVSTPGRSIPAPFWRISSVPASNFACPCAWIKA